MTIVKSLTQLREIVSKALSGKTNLGKSFRTFFIETMELYLTHKGRLNFTQMARCERSSGCAVAMKKGLEILGISIVDVDAKDSVFLKAEQTFTEKKRAQTSLHLGNERSGFSHRLVSSYAST